MKGYSNYFRRDRDAGDIAVGCLIILITAILLVGLTFLYAAIGVWLWGAIIVPVFGAPVLTYWQMFGIMILMRMVFGSFTSASNSSRS